MLDARRTKQSTKGNEILESRESIRAYFPVEEFRIVRPQAFDETIMHHMFLLKLRLPRTASYPRCSDTLSNSSVNRLSDPLSAPTDGRLCDSLPALPSKTKGPASFLGVI